MITFFRIPSESPNVRKAAIMLEEVAIPYEERIVEKAASGEVDEEFLKLSPNGTTPAIYDADTGVTVFESAAVLIYLAEKSGKLLPADSGKRAEVMKWVMFEAANISPTMAEIHHFLLNDYDGHSDTILERYKGRLRKYCTILDNRLAESEYLGGEFSIADIILFPWIVTLEDMAEIDITDFPHLNRWATAIGQRASAQ